VTRSSRGSIDGKRQEVGEGAEAAESFVGRNVERGQVGEFLDPQEAGHVQMGG
jgi:hypothetical protein